MYHVFSPSYPFPQPGVPEDELGSAEEVHQRSHQQGKRVQHRQHHPGAAAGERRPWQVTETSNGLPTFLASPTSKRLPLSPRLELQYALLLLAS